MPIFCRWIAKSQSIVGIDYIGSWTLEENDQSQLDGYQLIKHIDTRFDLVVNSLKSAYTLPVGTLWHWIQLVERFDIQEPHWGLTVYVMESKVHEAYFEEANKVSKAFQKHCRLAHNTQQALELIQADRQLAQK